MAEKSCRPGEEDRQSSHSESGVSLFSAKFGELHTPVQRAEEGEDDGTVGDLDMLDHVKVFQGVFDAQASDIGDTFVCQRGSRVLQAYLGWLWKLLGRGRRCPQKSRCKESIPPDLG